VAPRTSANGEAPDADGETPDWDGETPSQAMRHCFYEGFSWFVAAYRTAAEKLQKGGACLPEQEDSRIARTFYITESTSWVSV